MKTIMLDGENLSKEDVLFRGDEGRGNVSPACFKSQCIHLTFINLFACRQIFQKPFVSV